MNKDNIFKKVYQIIFCSFLFSPYLLFAQTKIVNPAQRKETGELLEFILNIAIKIGTPIIVLAVVYAGFSYVLAQGNPEKISQAHRLLLWTLVGGIVLLGAVSIKMIVFNTAKDLGFPVNL